VQLPDLLLQCGNSAGIVYDVIGGSEPFFPLNLGGDDAPDLPLREPAALSHPANLQGLGAVHHQYPSHPLPEARGFDQ